MKKPVYTFKAKGGHKSKKSSNLIDDVLKKVANSCQSLGQIASGIKEMKESKRGNLLQNFQIEKAFGI